MCKSQNESSAMNLCPPMHLPHEIQDSAMHSNQYKIQPLKENMKKYTPAVDRKDNNIQYESMHFSLCIHPLFFMVLRIDSIDTEAPS